MSCLRCEYCGDVNFFLANEYMFEYFYCGTGGMTGLIQGALFGFCFDFFFGGWGKNYSSVGLCSPEDDES